MATRELYQDGKYLDLNPDWHAGDSAWKADQVLKMLTRNNLRPRTVCEVGCGAGEILAQLHNRMPDDVHFTGYEVSPQAAQLCEQRRKPGLDFILGDAFADPAQYDMVLSLDVIEHVEDIYGFLRALRKKGAHKVFHIPLDLAVYSVLGGTLIRGRRQMGHIHYFTRATALALLEEAGYDVMDWFYTFGAIQSPGQRGGPVPRRLLRLVRRMMHIVNKELSVRVLGGASILVLAK